MTVKLKLNAVIKKGTNGWFIGFIEEIPGVCTQGKTIKETKENLIDALELYAEAQREESKKTLKGEKVIREELIMI